MLSTTTADKLVKLLALATCPTAQPDEVHAAMLAADRMVKAAGMSWDAVLAGRAGAQAPPEPPRPHRPHPDQERHHATPQARAAALLRDHGDRLTPWAAGFC